MPSLPTPPRRRLTFTRLLLALVLGLAAWWGVGWWVSPRPLYTLNFPDAGPIDVTWPALSYHFRVGVNAHRQLNVERPNVPDAGKLQVELYNLANGLLLEARSHDAATYHKRPEAAWWWYGVNHRIAVPPLSGTGTPVLGRLLFPVKNSGQAVRVALAPFPAGELLDELLRRVPLAADWTDPDRHVAGVWDNGRGRFLWSVPVFFRPDWETEFSDTTEGDYLVVVQRRQGRVTVSVLQLPLANYCPWWSRSAGLFVFALALFARRHHRVALAAA